MRPALARQSNPASSRAAAPPPAVSLPVSDNLGRELHGKLVTALAVERSCDAGSDECAVEHSSRRSARRTAE